MKWTLKLEHIDEAGGDDDIERGIGMVATAVSHETVS